MSDFLQDPLLANELKQLRPAQPPVELMNRLTAPPAVRVRTDLSPRPENAKVTGWFRIFLRALVPVSATALVIAGAFLLRPQPPTQLPQAPNEAAPLVADDVSVDSELVTSFEAVAELPGGEPVRVRCREWMDNVVVRDRSRGVTIQQNKPRMEVVPVRFETY